MIDEHDHVICRIDIKDGDRFVFTTPGPEPHQSLKDNIKRSWSEFMDSSNANRIFVMPHGWNLYVIGQIDEKPEVVEDRLVQTLNGPVKVG